MPQTIDAVGTLNAAILEEDPMDTKPQEALVILKLYEIRSEPLMRAARAWFFSEFSPQSGKGIVALLQSGEKQSACAGVIRPA